MPASLFEDTEVQIGCDLSHITQQQMPEPEVLVRSLLGDKDETHLNLVYENKVEPD